METRRTVTMIAVCTGIFALWFVFVTYYNKKYPPLPPGSTPEQVSNTGAAPSTTSTTQSASTTGPSSAPAISAGLRAIEIPGTSGASTSVVIGSPDKSVSAMQVFLTPRGAGIEKVILNQFKADDGKPYTFEQPYTNHAGTEPMATRTVAVNGVTIDLTDAPWKLLQSDARSASYGVMIADGETPVAKVTKTYTLSQPKDANLGYEVAIKQLIEPVGERELTVKQSFNGPTEPPREIQRGGDIVVLVGFNLPSKKMIDVVQHATDGSDFKPGAAGLDLTQNGDQHHAMWAGQVSTYFNALILPKVGEDLAQRYSVHAQALNPDDSDNRQVAMTFDIDPQTIKPGGQSSVELTAYFGPKSRGVLTASGGYYEAYPRMYNIVLVTRSSLCGFCTWDWLIDVLLKILQFFHLIFRDWGVAIICLVVVVRTLLHPLTRNGQIHMMKMQKMAPEMEKLKKKYADDKEGLNRAMMEYQKEALPAQLFGCAPMFLQTPIWIALWSALQSTFELRQAPFLYGFTWIKDLAKPDGLITFSHAVPIPLIVTTVHISGINILPILMAVATYVNQKYFMPKPTATLTPEQEQTQKMTQGMSMFFPLMFYSFPSGLNLYYLTSMTIGVIESKIVRDHIKAREEAEKAGKVFVPITATRGKRMGNDSVQEQPQPKGLIARLMERLQNWVEEIRKEQGKGGKN
ncbi:MAG TPA: YidC/Oxa1 family insertase periplasmic-domain containing protein [Humisphaera sp.]|jgi:YidC/Oxa1 family membrane protein insertase|nr:YidC/Oxa1 family insertase periplasmic-domain containing protein [Humisphaera sp.]